MSMWTTGRTPLAAVVEAQTATLFDVYRADYKRLEEDAKNEAKISTGGYGTRQLEELVQNAVDATRAGGHRIEIVLTDTALYVANDGSPFDARGIEAVMAANLSPKDEDHIGRFGIGFKSVLAVSDSPRIYSTSVSFGFDQTHAAEQLRSAGYSFKEAATMRTAIVLDQTAAFAGDAVLADLARWASTIIALPLRDRSAHRMLSARLDLFRDEFMLFSPHVTHAAFRNEAQVVFTEEDVLGLSLSPEESKQLLRHQPATTRLLRVSSLGEGIHRLHVNDEAADWAVARTDHHPSAAARRDGAYAADRRVVEVSYAVCLTDERYGIGQFWAYFPTADAMTLSGIVNAPWKLSDDRKHLLRGAFNEELLTQVLPGLVGDAFRAFEGSERTVAVLDAMPARGGEARSDADDLINEPVFRHLRRQRVLPDGDGTLRIPGEIRWLGGDTVGKNIPVRPEWLRRWQDAGGHVARWVHPLAYTTRERRSKVQRLMTEEERSVAAAASGIDEWLEDLADDQTVLQSARALVVAAWLVVEAGHLYDRLAARHIVDQVHRAKIVRTEDGTFAAATRGRLFVRDDGEDRPDVQFVEPAVVDSAGVEEALSILGVVLLDRTGQLHALLARARRSGGAGDPASLWADIWSALRDIPQETALGLLREDLDCKDVSGLAGAMRVRTKPGPWVGVAEAYLAGDVVPADGSRDAQHLIDPEYHRSDVGLLQSIGATPAPAEHPVAMPRERWYEQYVDEMKDFFIDVQPGSKPGRSYIVVSGGQVLWPMQVLVGMSSEAREVATARIVAQGSSPTWTVHHRTNSNYGRYDIPSPEIWFIRRYGLLRTAFGPRRPQDVLMASGTIDPAVLPALEVSRRIASDLGLMFDPADLTTGEWHRLKTVADTWTHDGRDDVRRAAFYTWAARFLAPSTIVCRVGDGVRHEDPANVGVTSDEDTYSALLEAQVPGLLVAEGGESQLVERWSMRPGKDLLHEEIRFEPAGEDGYLVDLVPSFKMRLAQAQQGLKLQLCSRLERLIDTPHGQRSTDVPARLDGDTVLVTAHDPAARIRQISDALGLRLSPTDVSTILDEGASTRSNQLRQRIRSAGDDDDRLLLAVGVDALRRSIPVQALQHLVGEGRETTPREVSALARAVHGVAILKHLRHDLLRSGLQPPLRWTGRRETRDWVSALGFPVEWAGFATRGRPPVEVVQGPAVLHPLHDYQVKVTENIGALLRGGGGDRGIVSLPTGAGKTRVTVEALVNGLNDGSVDLSRPLVWVAQTDELCEQAAETWRFVWRAIGRSTPLRLGRLWATNEVPEDPGSFQLIIATISKLDAIQKRVGDDYDWLRQPSVVVIDEAHTSIASSYTQVLEWMGRGTRSRGTEERKPLIGLTATPFRGSSTDETKRLAARYDHRRLDSGAFRDETDPYTELQEMEVLARVEHQIIDGTEVSFTDADLDNIDRYGQVPAAVMQRLETDLARTERIVESIAALPDDWSVLVFSTSLENARVLAALLTHRGVTAVSVSSETDTAARRYYVEEFKAGRIRVLTNYRVFMQGFDAPKVQAVYVAQPTFSPNVYQQMVGRGLRGPRNGGSAEVRIVNVLDNFLNYGGRLAFRDFEYLWGGP